MCQPAAAPGLSALAGKEGGDAAKASSTSVLAPMLRPSSFPSMRATRSASAEIRSDRTSTRPESLLRSCLSSARSLSSLSPTRCSTAATSPAELPHEAEDREQQREVDQGRAVKREGHGQARCCLPSPTPSRRKRSRRCNPRSPPPVRLHHAATPESPTVEPKPCPGAI